MSEVIDFVEAKSRLRKIPETLKDRLRPEEFEPFSMQLALTVAGELVDVLEAMGFDITKNPKNVYDLILLIESIRALTHRTAGKSYPTCALSEQIFDVENPGEALQFLLEDMELPDEDG